MKILLLAPHPFYQERGTPIAVDLLARALAERGDRVDLLAYHEGTTPDYPPGIRVHRIAAPPFVRGVRPGFSGKKLVCDVFLARAAFGRARSEAYDVVHAVEESVFMAMRIRRRFGIPYLFDMDSSMPRQVAAKCACFRPFLPWMTRMEAAAIRNAMIVVPMCDALAQLATSAGAPQVAVLRDISLLRREVTDTPGALRRELGIRGTCYLYLGNLEPYQGMDLLLDAFQIAAGTDPEAALLIAGGTARHIEHYRRKTVAAGLANRVHFIGPWPLDRMADLFENTDVLVSPRVSGENTPMKIYSYLDSGKAVLATRLPTHTQVVDETTAVLADPEPAAFAEGLRRLADPALRRSIGARGRALAREKYSGAAFRRAVRDLYDRVEKSIARKEAIR